MSPTIGKHQKRILAVLEVIPDLVTFDLAKELHGGSLTAIQYANLRAALTSLEHRGYVELYSAWVPDPWWPEKHSSQPAVRLPSDKPHRYQVAKGSVPAV